MNITQVNENELQKAVHVLISDPSVITKTTKGRRLQILSPGRINVHEGPDFLDIAILIDSRIVVGDAEFHKKSSNWIEHNHSSDKNYKRVILHIVIEDDIEINFNFLTLVLDRKELAFALKNLDVSTEIDIRSIEDLQHFALLRLLRKTSEAQKILNFNNYRETYFQLAKNFLLKYQSRRRRPNYNDDRLGIMLEELKNSGHFIFLNDLQNGNEISIQDNLQNLLKMKISNEGSHLRREIILNALLPVAICLANDLARINLFLWYWSTPSLNKYGSLSRRFPELPQNFLWQQQGMLEFIKDKGTRPNVISETLHDYGFAEVLSFYKYANAPFNEIEIEE